MKNLTASILSKQLAKVLDKARVDMLALQEEMEARNHHKLIQAQKELKEAKNELKEAKNDVHRISTTLDRAQYTIDSYSAFFETFAEELAPLQARWREVQVNKPTSPERFTTRWHRS